MHGNYRILVVRDRPKLHTALDTNILYEYSAPTHPQEGQRIAFGDESLLVNGVRHVLKSGRNGFDTYHTLDYVEVKVY